MKVREGVDTMKKTVLRIIILLMLGFLFVIYMKNDGLYMINKMFSTQLEMINQYAAYFDNKFPETTIIKEYMIKDDMKSFFFSHNKCIKAILLVPNDEANKIIPEYARDYDLKYIIDLSKGKAEENVNYGVIVTPTVKKWLTKIDRGIFFTFMQPGEKYTKIYVSVDMLGWNIVKEKE